MKNKYKVLLFVFMVGCTPVNSSTNSSFSSNSSSTPQPEIFEKFRDGKAVLFEKTTHINFSRENNLTKVPVRLLPENYRETENAWVPYKQEQSPIGDPVFSTHWWDEQQFNGTLLQPTASTQEVLVALFESWLPFDDAFVFRQEDVFLRDLSHEYVNGEYYWFNNFIDTYTTQYARIEDQYVYGFAQVDRIFQTLNEISFQREHTISYDETHIYSLQDETFPFGFFGAIDQKIITSRSGDNTKHALSLGPARYLLNTLAYWDFLIENAIEDETINPYAQQFWVEKVSSRDVDVAVKLIQPIQTLQTKDYVEHTITAQIRNLEWASFVETEILWLNEDRV